MYPELFSIGNVKVYTYGLFVALGIIAGFNLSMKLGRFRAVSKGFINYLVTGAVISGIIGARLAYVAISFEDYSGDIPRIIMFWEGGLVFWGGIIGGAVWVLYACSKWNLNAGSVGDIFSPGIALGHAIGRIGCFFAGCCYGKSTDSCVGISFTNQATLARPMGVPLHPTQLYESFLLFILAALLYVRIKSPKSAVSSVFGSYLVSYGIIRIFTEHFRGDFRGYLISGVTPTQFIAILAMILGFIMIIKSKKHKIV